MFGVLFQTIVKKRGLFSRVLFFRQPLLRNAAGRRLAWKARIGKPTAIALGKSEHGN
jgi:hypothetical protein